ncbi:hypothetical protein [Nocardia sp. NPDC050710]|uniref:zinc finger domain-containing protein n=1 Tax=Nocardia sp. NPDC050710 TaxID=3157220 RepID=UPI00340BDFFE
MPEQLVRPLPGRNHVVLYDIDAARRAVGLTIVCPYEPCQASAGKPCTRTDVTGRRWETRLLHPVRINTAERERAETATRSNTSSPQKKSRPPQPSARTRASRRSAITTSLTQSGNRYRPTTANTPPTRARRRSRRLSRLRAERQTRQGSA